MNTARVYQDIDGNELTIHQMVRREKDWAAARIQQAEMYEAALKLWYEQQKDRVGRKGNGPGCGHSTPGIWDSDNGTLAGKECGECKLWAIAVRQNA